MACLSRCRWTSSEAALRGSGVACSNVAATLARPTDWRDRRTSWATGDAGLVGEIRLIIAELSSYGYRQVWGVLRQARGVKTMKRAYVAFMLKPTWPGCASSRHCSRALQRKVSS
ncbi:Transposase (plasmid) [Mycetohabitans rhizoxinica HKI 454]|uniref:Transposase n=1 Tax=Mycetohabitans rhizoxinica (strain DSM 19002 / CIP 109453 / HKI 454) TaxID=882378 RepID=E5AVB2_MYCRK|nr:Transposase [Mycetohabitans rhizoxinica HKI 454]